MPLNELTSGGPRLQSVSIPSYLSVGSVGEDKFDVPEPDPMNPLVQPLPKNYTVSGYGPEAYGFSGTTGLNQYRGQGRLGMQMQFWQALQAANRAMQAAGLGAFSVTDGFRSYKGQVNAKRNKGKLAATPGRSVHGLGLAADLGLNDRQFRWLKANGATYGLINLPSESWHWQLAPSLWKGGWK